MIAARETDNRSLKDFIEKASEKKEREESLSTNCESLISKGVKSLWDSQSPKLCSPTEPALKEPLLPPVLPKETPGNPEINVNPKENLPIVVDETIEEKGYCLCRFF